MKYTIEEIKEIADKSYIQTTRPDDNIDQYFRDADQVNCCAYANVLETMERNERIYNEVFPHGELINEVQMWKFMYESVRHDMEAAFAFYAERCKNRETKEGK